MDFIDILLLVPALLFAVTIHEVAHGWVAFRRGDPTAFLMGRLTLNPIKHLDPFGSFIMPAMLALLRAPFVFGWAKPVPVNFFGLRNPQRDMIWVSLAGPGSNLLVAVAAGVLLRLALPFYGGPGTPLYPVVRLLANFVLIDLALAVFNLIPIPPLDGSHIFFHFFVRPHTREHIMFKIYSFMEQFGFLLLMVLMFAFPADVNPFDYVFSKALGALLWFIQP